MLHSLRLRREVANELPNRRRREGGADVIEINSLTTAELLFFGVFFFAMRELKQRDPEALHQWFFPTLRGAA